VKILIEEEDINEAYYHYGDMFRDVDEDTFFLFVERPKIALVSFCGKDFYEEFGSFEEAVNNIRLFIKDGELKYLSQDKWQLQLKRK